MVGKVKHSFFDLVQPKSKYFEPLDIGICAAERDPHPRLFLASAHCPSGRCQCRCPGKPVRVCAVPRAL
jgi:hypothetical protein